MNEIQKRLDRAYMLLGKMSVSGDVVDVMYGIRQELREAFRLAENATIKLDKGDPVGARGPAGEAVDNG